MKEEEAGEGEEGDGSEGLGEVEASPHAARPGEPPFAVRNRPAEEAREQQGQESDAGRRRRRGTKAVTRPRPPIQLGPLRQGGGRGVEWRREPRGHRGRAQKQGGGLRLFARAGSDAAAGASQSCCSRPLRVLFIGRVSLW